MTKKQAAKILRQGSKMAWDAEEFCEAYDMAIQALEQQPSDEIIKYLECNDIDVQKFTKDMKKQRLQAIKSNISEDCVSRQAVLDILSHYAHNFGADNEIKSLPPVKPTQSWIPIITREPTEEEKKDYFVTELEKLEQIEQIIDDCDSGMISCEQLFLNLKTILEQE